MYIHNMITNYLLLPVFCRYTVYLWYNGIFSPHCRIMVRLRLWNPWIGIGATLWVLVMLGTTGSRFARFLFYFCQEKIEPHSQFETSNHYFHTRVHQSKENVQTLQYANSGFEQPCNLSEKSLMRFNGCVIIT